MRRAQLTVARGSEQPRHCDSGSSRLPQEARRCRASNYALHKCCATAAIHAQHISLHFRCVRSIACKQRDDTVPMLTPRLRRAAGGAPSCHLLLLRPRSHALCNRRNRLLPLGIACALLHSATSRDNVHRRLWRAFLFHVCCKALAR